MSITKTVSNRDIFFLLKHAVLLCWEHSHIILFVLLCRAKYALQVDQEFPKKKFKPNGIVYDV